MRALLLFHIRVGVRIAVRSAAPLFCAILAMIMLQMYPAAVVKAAALGIFAPDPAITDLLPVIFIALILPAWAAPRLVIGLNGWMRHLAIGTVANRRGLALSLIITQIPLAVALVLLAVVAQKYGRPVSAGLVRYCVLLTAGALASLPARRWFITTPLAMAAAGCALFGNWLVVLAGLGLLIAADRWAGAIRKSVHGRVWSSVGPLFSLRVAWRALGWEIAACYALPALIIGATALFASNNELPPRLHTATACFGGGMGISACIAGLAGQLAARRPVWPWARSLPWSSALRVTSDAVFLAAHSAPVLLVVILFDSGASLPLLALICLIATRAVSALKYSRERRTGIGVLLMEAFLASASISILPWMGILLLAATAPAFWAARRSEIRQKVTRWREMHYLTAGDPLSWSAQ